MPRREKEGITIADFAREMGVRPQSVRDRVKSGRMARAVLDDGSLDPERARVDWFANTNPNRIKPRAGDKSKPGSALKRDADASNPSEYDLKISLMGVELESKQIALEKLKESTIDRLEAARIVRGLMRMHRNVLVNFASRYGPEIAAECGTDERILIGSIESRLRICLNEAASGTLPFGASDPNGGDL